jgi:hypothetical protein
MIQLQACDYHSSERGHKYVLYVKATWEWIRQPQPFRYAHQKSTIMQVQARQPVACSLRRVGNPVPSRQAGDSRTQ